MIDAAGWALLRPAWLLAIAGVLLWALLARRWGPGRTGWERAVDPTLMTALESMGRVAGPATRNRIHAPTLVGALAALALVGPAQRRDDAPTFHRPDALVLAMDLSASSVRSPQFAQAVTAARFLAERAGSRPVALIVFAGDAYLASTPTTDARALGTTIAVLDGETVPDPGSRPERALALARDVLARGRVAGGDVVLVSDGGGLTDAARREARIIAQAGGRVSALHLAPGGSDPDGSGRDALAAVASEGGGRFGSVLDPLALAEDLRGTSAALASRDVQSLVWRDHGRAVLLLALLPALALFRRRS